MLVGYEIVLYEGDCLEISRENLKDNSVDSIITDAPYGLEFMGKDWDKGVPGVEYWKEFLRVAKPGCMLQAFGGTRTFHRLACAIEDAGWILRDCIMWVYGSGFPKSLNISKAFDKLAGLEREVLRRGKPVRKLSPGSTVNKTGLWRKRGGRGKEYIPLETLPASKDAREWEGWGTVLKPAWEPIILAMKPLEGCFIKNIRKWGVGGLWIDGCRVPSNPGEYDIRHYEKEDCFQNKGPKRSKFQVKPQPDGRWPANLILDEKAGRMLGPSSRFFYCPKASPKEKGKGNDHPTVKPLKLVEYLCKLTRTPKGGVVLDPFMGSGTTALACISTGRDFIGIEKEGRYIEIAEERIKKVLEKGEDT